ncbi:hypothetical protein GCM10017717_22960 [Deinococcus persicinus]
MNFDKENVVFMLPVVETEREPQKQFVPSVGMNGVVFAIMGS